MTDTARETKKEKLYWVHRLANMHIAICSILIFKKSLFIKAISKEHVYFETSGVVLINKIIFVLNNTNVTGIKFNLNR